MTKYFCTILLDYTVFKDLSRKSLKNKMLQFVLTTFLTSFMADSFSDILRLRLYNCYCMVKLVCYRACGLFYLHWMNLKS